MGTIIFIVVFMLALGTLAYSEALQTQASQAEQQAQGVDALRASESLTFITSSGTLEAVNGGGATVLVNHVILRYPNGTVYSFAASAAIPAGGETPVPPLIPASACSPGNTTCSSRYEEITSGNPPGSSVGLLTSFGDVFWYTASGAQPGWTEVKFTASTTWSVPPGAGWAYVVCVGGGGGGGGSGGATDAGGPAGSGGGGGRSRELRAGVCEPPRGELGGGHRGPGGWRRGWRWGDHGRRGRRERRGQFLRRVHCLRRRSRRRRILLHLQRGWRSILRPHRDTQRRER